MMRTCLSARLGCSSSWKNFRRTGEEQEQFTSLKKKVIGVGHMTCGKPMASEGQEWPNNSHVPRTDNLKRDRLGQENLYIRRNTDAK
jgi:hypothetical protein